jgi:hypothetical protein
MLSSKASYISVSEAIAESASKVSLATELENCWHKRPKVQYKVGKRAFQGVSCKLAGHAAGYKKQNQDENSMEEGKARSPIIKFGPVIDRC